MYEKLVETKKTGALMVSTPACVKAFLLKFIEGVHIVDQISNLGNAANIAMYRDQAATATDIFDLLREGILMMDEVDLILHPLKSELNFPIGKKRPLDLTQNKFRKGLRFKRPKSLPLSPPHPSIHARVCMRTPAHTCLRAIACTNAHMRSSLCECAHACACVHTCICRSVIHLCTCAHACLHTC